MRGLPAGEDVLVAGERGVADDDVDVGKRGEVEKLTHVLPQLGAFLGKKLRAKIRKSTNTGPRSAAKFEKFKPL